MTHVILIQNKIYDRNRKYKIHQEQLLRERAGAVKSRRTNRAGTNGTQGPMRATARKIKKRKKTEL